MGYGSFASWFRVLLMVKTFLIRREQRGAEIPLQRNFSLIPVLRYNPAVLAEATGTFQLRPLEFGGVVGENVVNTFQDISDHDFTSNNSDAVISFIRKFQDKFGDQHYGGLEGQILAVRILQLEVMPFLKNRSYIELRRPTIPKFDFELDTLAGINISYGHAFSEF